MLNAFIMSIVFPFFMATVVNATQATIAVASMEDIVPISMSVKNDFANSFISTH